MLLSWLTIASHSSIIIVATIQTVETYSSIILAVQQSCFSPSAPNIVQEYGSISTTKIGITVGGYS